MATVRMVGVGARYGRTQALTDVHLEFPDGAFCVVFGPAGAGKTTLLNVIAGLKQPSEGSVYFDDRDVRNVEPWDRDVAMVFESYALYPHMTVYENLRSPLERRRYRKDEADREVRQVAAVLGIEELLQRKPGTLSNGQRQRVGLGRALIRPSRALLMDEPLSHLDAKLASSMRLELKLVQTRFGRTVVYVTHNYREALGLADHLVILDQGNVLQVGTPREIFENPATDLVCRLLGEPARNMFSLRIGGNGARSGRLEECAEVDLPEWVARSGVERAVASVLPGDISIVSRNDDLNHTAGAATFAVVVRNVERKGFRNIVYAETEKGTELTFYTNPGVGFELHEHVLVTVAMDRAVYLDPDSGRALTPNGLGTGATAEQKEASA